MMSDQNGIYLTKKQASVASATLILLGLLIFIAGYFWGKRSMIDGFTQKTSQDSFNDQVDYLLTMQSFATKHGPLPVDCLEEQAELQQSDGDSEQDTLALLKDLPKDLVADEKTVSPTQKPTQKTLDTLSVMEPLKTGKHFAAMAGFAKKASAVAMVNRLKKYKIDLELKTKVSKSASGKATKTWYQVVTKKYDTKPEVEAVVDRVVSIEHIKRKDVKII